MRMKNIKNSNIKNIRNTGICAHIDAGKTTLTERILFYANRTHIMREIKSKDGKGPVMDFMELERERGITISSATTNIEWKDYKINIIDTPGHVDFTMEVENALRVLDNAVMVVCGVNGVQTQTFTVSKQLERYEVPYLIFINKLDREESRPLDVVEEIKEELGKNTALLQLPVREEGKLIGVIDLISMKRILFQGRFGEKIVEKNISDEDMKQAKFYRNLLLDSLTMYSEDLTEAYLNDTITESKIKDAILKCTIERKIVPIFLGSAFANKGIQLVLDGIVDYLPNPTEKQELVHNLESDNKEVILKPDPDLPTVVLVFKIEKNQYGQLTYLRIYQGKVEKGDKLFNNRSKKLIKIPKIAKMHADSMETIDKGFAGDIIAVFGIDCAIGDTLTSEGIHYTFRDSYIPDPLVFYSIAVKRPKDENKFTDAITHFVRQDPTFRSYYDEETKETIIAGMGELHLDIYLERMMREYNIEVETSSPRISYKEKITNEIDFSYTHQKQTGGRGEYAQISGKIIPQENDENIFEEEIEGGVIPKKFIPACEKSFYKCLEKGELVEGKIVGTKLLLNDGDFHPVDSSQKAFATATKKMFRKYYPQCNPRLLEPIMNLSVVTPSQFRGNIITILKQNRGDIQEVSVKEGISKIKGTIPLVETFGITKKFRSSSQGKAEFRIDFNRYKFLPKNMEEKIIEDIDRRKKESSK